jgi:Leucine-rich repeat (LRR) protein
MKNGARKTTPLAATPARNANRGIAQRRMPSDQKTQKWLDSVNRLCETCWFESDKRMDVGRYDLSDTGGVGVPYEILRYPIKVLIADHAKIEMLPEFMCKLELLTELDVNCNAIREFPVSLCALVSLQRLALSNNEISALPEEISQLTNLKAIAVDHNRLRSLPFGFGALTSLRDLNISHNTIEMLPLECSRFSKLQRFAAEGNPLTIPPLSLWKDTGISAALDMLKRCLEAFAPPYNLDLVGIGLNVLSPLISHFSHITSLSLAHNRLRSLPSELGRLAKLQTLDVAHNLLSWDQIRLTQAGFEGMASVHSIDVSFNQLVALPPSFGALPMLHTFKWEGNPELVSPPSEVLNRPITIIKMFLAQLHESAQGMCGRLEVRSCFLQNPRLEFASKLPLGVEPIRELCLSQNELSQIPRVLLAEPYAKLRHLDLSHNQIDSVPIWVQDLKVAVLDLSFNLISIFPPGLSQMKSLRNLLLAGNSISSLPNDLESFGRLIELNLSHNALPKLSRAFRGLTSLTALDVSHNKIEKLPQYETNLLTALVSLRISHNKLRSLPDLRNLASLTELSMKGNPLSVLPLALVENLHALKLFELDPQVFQGGARLCGNEWNDQVLSIVRRSLLTNCIDLSGVGLELVPAQIAAAVHCHSLNLSNNRLTVVPDEVGTMTNLTDLNLSANHLVELGAWVGCCTQLVLLDVSGNKNLETLPPELGLLGQLEILHVDDTCVVEPLPAVWESGIPKGTEFLLQYVSLIALAISVAFSRGGSV